MDNILWVAIKLDAVYVACWSSRNAQASTVLPVSTGNLVGVQWVIWQKQILEVLLRHNHIVEIFEVVGDNIAPSVNEFSLTDFGTFFVVK